MYLFQNKDYGIYQKRMEEVKNYFKALIPDVLFMITPESYTDGKLNEDGITLAITSRTLQTKELMKLVQECPLSSKTFFITGVDYDYAMKNYGEGGMDE